MKNLHVALLASTASLLAAQPAMAAITWADLTSQPNATTVVGTVGGIGVTYTGHVQFAQTAGGTNYWTPFPSVEGPATGPNPSDIIATSTAGLKTITFSQAVTDVYLAINSWNRQNATFSQPFSVYAEGCGFWGCGSAIVSNGNTTLTGSGELHGILRFTGPLTSLTYTDTVNENWHGIQIGIGALVNGAVPEPATWAMMIAGFGLVGAALRRQRKVRATVRFA